MKNKYKIITNSTNRHSKKAIFKELSRSFSYAPRSLRVCFGSEMRPGFASVGFIHRSFMFVHSLKYTNDIFKLLHNFIFIILTINYHQLTIIYQRSTINYQLKKCAQPLRLEDSKQAGGILFSPDSIN